MTQPAIVWFRDDQRVADNPAVDAAVASGRPLLCVYVHDEESDGIRPLGGAAKWWLHGSLRALVFSGFFTILWLTSATFFRAAAQGEHKASASS